MRLVRAALAPLLAFAVGWLATLFVNPGYSLYVTPLLVALVPAVGLAALLRGTTRALLALCGACAVAGGVVLLATAPAGPDRGRIVREHRAVLAAVPAPDGVREGAPHTRAESPSDFAASVINPPHSYVTTRVDRLPSGAVEETVGAAYLRVVRRAGFRGITQFRLHFPLGFEIDARRGATSLVIQVQNGAALLTAQ